MGGKWVGGGIRTGGWGFLWGEREFLGEVVGWWGGLGGVLGGG